MNIKNKKVIITVLSLSLIFSACSNDNDGNIDNQSTEINQVNEFDKEDFNISVVSREDGSGTRGAFIELLGLEVKENGKTKDMTTSEAIVQNSTNGVMQTVSKDPTAIGYVSLGSVNDSVQKVKVDGVEATEKNIESGSYKLQRPFNLAFKKDNLDELTKDFLDFVLSEDAQNIVSEQGYIKVKAKDYKAKSVKGDLTIAGSTSVSPLMEKLVEKYKQINPKANIEIQSTGSSAGIESTISDVSQIAMASRELKDEEKEKLDVEILAKDGIAVVVNKDDSKINNLSKEELKKIFSGEITNTSELK